MKKFSILFSIIILSCSHAFPQNDQLFFNGQKDPVKCNIIEVSRDGVIYKTEKDSTHSALGTTGFDHLQLSYAPGDSGYSTSDLFKLIDQNDLDPFVWYGIDFTYLKICHPKLEWKYSIDFFNRMNKRIVASGSFHQAPSPPGFSREDRVSRNLSGFHNTDITQVHEANSKTGKANRISCQGSYGLPLDSIRKAINNYQPGQYKKGIGIVVFYLGINKHEEHYTVSVNFFDIKTGTILLTCRQELHGTGGGMENHWSGTLVKMLKKMRNSYGSLYQDLAKIYGIE